MAPILRNVTADFNDSTQVALARSMMQVRVLLRQAEVSALRPFHRI